MSFASPVLLIALLAVPLLIWAYAYEQRRRAGAVNAFVAPALTPSVAPNRPRWRRHVPLIAALLALILLIIAAARPQRTVAVPLTSGAVMLVNDVSSSMAATDVKPTRLAAAEQAARRFVGGVPGTIRVGLLEFAKRPIVLQSPSADHSLTDNALTQLRTSGGTAMGEALTTATNLLSGLPVVAGKHPPAAIVLLSDGASNVGGDPRVVARAAGAKHIPIYTIALGTDQGTIAVTRHGQTSQVRVPPSPQELGQIASLSGGRAFTAADSSGLRAVYSHLAARLGHKQAKQEITADFAGGGLALLLIGAVFSLAWFGRLV